MAVKIRLRRTGAKNAACFRIVAADTRSPRDGRFLETLGWYDPKMAQDNFRVDLGRVDHWISQGAQPSDTVKSLVRKARLAGDTPVAAEEVAVPEPDEAEVAEMAADPVETEAPEAEVAEKTEA